MKDYLKMMLMILIIKMMMIDYPFLLGDAGVSLDQKGVVTSKQTPD